MDGASITPTRARSRLPNRYDTKITHAAPAIIAGIIGTKISPASIPSAPAARAVGPPHGRMFMTPPACMITLASISRLSPSRWYSGRSADVTMRYVVEPSPSSEMRSVSTDVPTRMRSGSPCTSCTTRLTIGSNRPTSIMTLKYRIANSSMTAVGARARTPSSIIGPMSRAKPPMIANAIGTRMSAVSTDMRFVMISAMKTTIMANASSVSMGYVA